MKEIDRRVAALAARQHGVVSRDQAIQLGLDQSALWRRTNGGTLIALGPKSLLVPGQNLTWRGELTAGVLDLGSDALVSAAAAARLLGLDGFDTEVLDYLVPRSQRGRVTKGRVSSSGEISRLDRTTVDGLPCTSATRTVVELLKLGTLEEAGRALDSACLRRLTAHAAVRRRLDELGRQGRAGVAAFEELVRTGTVESWLERRFIDVIRRARLPVPTLQQRYELPAFGVARVEFEYPLWGIVIEVGGQRGYLSVDERQRQEHRRNALQLAGRTIYFFTHDDVVHREPYVIGTIAQALGTAPTRRGRPDTA